MVTSLFLMIGLSPPAQTPFPPSVHDKLSYRWMSRPYSDARTLPTCSATSSLHPAGLSGASQFFQTASPPSYLPQQSSQSLQKSLPQSDSALVCESQLQPQVFCCKKILLGPKLLKLAWTVRWNTFRIEASIVQTDFELRPWFLTCLCSSRSDQSFHKWASLLFQVFRLWLKVLRTFSSFPWSWHRRWPQQIFVEFLPGFYPEFYAPYWTWFCFFTLHDFKASFIPQLCSSQYWKLFSSRFFLTRKEITAICYDRTWWFRLFIFVCSEHK